MAATFTKLLVHITFSTKNREPIIPESLEPDLYSYIGGICRRMHSPLLSMNGPADHVHLLVSLGKTVALSDLMMEVKRDSSKWIKERDAGLRAFHWQDGYFGFSIGVSAEEDTKAYIANQKAHHASVDFKGEVRAILLKNKMDWDERYIWD